MKKLLFASAILLAVVGVVYIGFQAFSPKLALAELCGVTGFPPCDEPPNVTITSSKPALIVNGSTTITWTIVGSGPMSCVLSGYAGGPYVHPLVLNNIPANINAYEKITCTNSVGTDYDAVYFQTSELLKSFTSGGSFETFTVPAGITQVGVGIGGGGGGGGGCAYNCDSGGGYGGAGGKVAKVLDVTPGDVLKVFVGAGGSGGGSNYGALAGGAGGGGGGASAVYYPNNGNIFKIIAGGGGGGGGGDGDGGNDEYGEGGDGGNDGGGGGGGRGRPVNPPNSIGLGGVGGAGGGGGGATDNSSTAGGSGVTNILGQGNTGSFVGGQGGGGAEGGTSVSSNNTTRNGHLGTYSFSGSGNISNFSVELQASGGGVGGVGILETGGKGMDGFVNIYGVGSLYISPPDYDFSVEEILSTDRDSVNLLVKYPFDTNISSRLNAASYPRLTLEIPNRVESGVQKPYLDASVVGSGNNARVFLEARNAGAGYINQKGLERNCSDGPFNIPFTYKISSSQSITSYFSSLFDYSDCRYLVPAEQTINVQQNNSVDFTFNRSLTDISSFTEYKVVNGVNQATSNIEAKQYWESVDTPPIGRFYVEPSTYYDETGIEVSPVSVQAGEEYAIGVGYVLPLGKGQSAAGTRYAAIHVTDSGSQSISITGDDAITVTAGQTILKPYVANYSGSMTVTSVSWSAIPAGLSGSVVQMPGIGFIGVPSILLITPPSSVTSTTTGTIVLTAHGIPQDPPFPNPIPNSNPKTITVTINPAAPSGSGGYSLSFNPTSKTVQMPNEVYFDLNIAKTGTCRTHTFTPSEFTSVSGPLQIPISSIEEIDQNNDNAVFQYHLKPNPPTVAFPNGLLVAYRQTPISDGKCPGTLVSLASATYVVTAPATPDYNISAVPNPIAVSRPLSGTSNAAATVKLQNLVNGFSFPASCSNTTFTAPTATRISGPSFNLSFSTGSWAFTPGPNSCNNPVSWTILPNTPLGTYIYRVSVTGTANGQTITKTTDVSVDVSLSANFFITAEPENQEVLIPSSIEFAWVASRNSLLPPFSCTPSNNCPAFARLATGTTTTGQIVTLIKEPGFPIEDPAWPITHPNQQRWTIRYDVPSTVQPNSGKFTVSANSAGLFRTDSVDYILSNLISGANFDLEAIPTTVTIQRPQPGGVGLSTNSGSALLSATSTQNIFTYGTPTASFSSEGGARIAPTFNPGTLNWTCFSGGVSMQTCLRSVSWGATATTSLGSYNFTVSVLGTAGPQTITRTASVRVQVDDVVLPGGYTLTIDPPKNKTIQVPGSASYTIRVARSGSFTGAVNLTYTRLSNLPTGMSAILPSQIASGASTATLQITAGANTTLTSPTQNFPFTVQGNAPGVPGQHEDSGSLTIGYANNGCALSYTGGVRFRDGKIYLTWSSTLDPTDRVELWRSYATYVLPPGVTNNWGAESGPLTLVSNIDSNPSSPNDVKSVRYQLKCVQGNGTILSTVNPTRDILRKVFAPFGATILEQ